MVSERCSNVILHQLKIMNDKLTIRVPATSANMGPGFDCLGMALDLWNTISIEFGESGFIIEGEGVTNLPKDNSNLVYSSFERIFLSIKKPIPDVRIICKNEIPMGRGLGSSSAAIVGGLFAGNEVCNRPFSVQQLLDLAAKLEGHPDNVTPAFLGGCQVAVRDGKKFVTNRIQLPDDLRVVLYVPDEHTSILTDESRSRLSNNVTREDAVYNIGRAAMLVSALISGDLTNLNVATGDRLHQPARQSQFPGMTNIMRAALGAGALGAFLSGSGPSILAFANGREFTIGYEMADAAAKSLVEGSIHITKPVDIGVHTISDDGR